MIRYYGKHKLITEYSIEEYRQMGSSLTSTGERVTTVERNHRVRLAKIQKLENFFSVHGYYFCEDCKRNDCVPIDCSHDISVDTAVKTGRTELCWDVNNITLRGRKCHQKHDRNGVNQD